MGCHSLLQGIFPTQGLNPHLPHWEADSLPLSHQGRRPKDLSSWLFPSPPDSSSPTQSIKKKVKQLPGIQTHEQMLIPIQLGILLTRPKWTKSLNSYTITPKPSQLFSPFLQGSSRCSVTQTSPIRQCPGKSWYEPQISVPGWYPNLYFTFRLPCPPLHLLWKDSRPPSQSKNLQTLDVYSQRLILQTNTVSLQSFFFKAIRC